MKTLTELNSVGDLFLTDKGSIHDYLRFYEKLFENMRSEKLNIFEVGYQYGGSCKLWDLYFPDVQIRAIDIKRWEPTTERETFKLHNEFIEPKGNIRLDFIDIKDLNDDYFADFKPDIAIDDGSHNLEDQIMFVKKVYPHLREYGYLIVEDIQDYDKAVYEFDKLGLIFHTVDLRDIGVYDDVFIYFTKPEFTTNYGSINYSNRGKAKTI
jgi:hypothetical protein